MEKHILSKSTFIRGVQCLKSLYLHNKRPYLRDKLSPEQLAVFRRGTKLGIIAQRLFPGGIDLRPRSYRQYAQKLEQTRKHIESDNEDIILYEAGFQYDRLLSFIDVLVKNQNRWTAYEVKSSTKISETFLIDAAFQYYVITNSELKLDDFQIIYVNENYKHNKKASLNDIFIKESVLDEVLKRQNFIAEKVEEEKKVFELEKSPQIEPGDQCTTPYPCDFIGHCWKKIPKEKWPKIEYKDESFYDFVDEILNTVKTGR